MEGLAPDTKSSPYFLEAHYYSGGLRFAPLGTGGVRPIWAPDASRVGFRDEVALLEGDAAIEFYRIIHEREKLTWVGIFYRSVDDKFGDRQNHAGMGVWLRGYQVVDAEKLLYGLRQFAQGIAENSSADDLEQKAYDFLNRFLGRYVAAHDAYPDQLGGWNFSQPELSKSEIFIAQSTDIDRRWDLVSDQILRASFLPGPSANHSRALIIATGSRVERRSSGTAKIEPLTGHFSKEILEIIPDIGMEIRRENQTYSQKLSDVTEKARSADDRAARAEAENASLRRSITELENEIKGNDVLSSLLKVSSKIDDLTRLSRSSETYAREMMDKLNANSSILKRIELSPVSQGSPQPTRTYPPSDYNSRGYGRPATSEQELHPAILWVGGLIALIALVALIIYIVHGLY